MGILNTAIYESFNMEEDFSDEVLASAEESIKDNEYIEESVGGNSIWDIVEPQVQSSKSSGGSTWDILEPQITNESIITEASDMTISNAIDKYYSLLRKDIPPVKAKAIVMGEEEEIQESLTESNNIMDNKSKYDPEIYMQKVVEQYKRAAKIPLDEELTEEKLKYEDWRIKSIAMRSAVPSADLKKALLKRKINED